LYRKAVPYIVNAQKIVHAAQHFSGASAFALRLA